MATPERKTCENCSDEFEPKFPEQKLCYSCWKELNSARNFRANGKERLLGALGREFCSDSKLKNLDREEGISDKELLLDKTYAETVTQPLGVGSGREPRSEVSNTRNPQQIAEQRRSDGLVGKFPLMEKAVLVGRNSLNFEKQTLQKKQQTHSESRQMTTKKVCESKPSRIRIVSPIGEVRFITSEKAMAILSEIPLWRD